MEPIKKLLQNKFFSELNKRKEEIDNLQNIVSSYLPDSINKKIIVKNLFKNELILEVKNNPTAHMLKMHQSDLLKELINEKYEINKIKVKITIPIYQRKKTVVKIPDSVNKKLVTISSNMSASPLKEIVKDLFKTKDD
tara:strand:- start:339 stop:752 length:414 start_codon:yes stop_codon:yes gene_type:complete